MMFIVWFPKNHILMTLESSSAAVAICTGGGRVSQWLLY